MKQTANFTFDRLIIFVLSIPLNREFRKKRSNERKAGVSLTMPGFSWGSRLYISRYLPRMKRKRRRQYCCPIEFTPRWYTQPKYSNVRPSSPPPPPPAAPDPLEPSQSDLSLPGFSNEDVVSIGTKQKGHPSTEDPRGKKKRWKRREEWERRIVETERQPCAFLVVVDVVGISIDR